MERLISRIDTVAGRAIEGAMRAHHRRRLAGLGRLEQLDPPQDGRLWCAGSPAPRPGCQLDVLVDGEAALSQIADTIEGARSHVHVAGWHLEPNFELRRAGGGGGDGPAKAANLRELLAELAERVEVKVLAWAGAPLPVFTPSRAEVRRTREQLVAGTRIACALDQRERPMHCHHEKLVIVDDEVAFVGGIDLTSLGGDRYDSSEHPLRPKLGWHDVATRLRGPAVADVAEHFRARWREVAGDGAAAGAVPGQPGAVQGQPGVVPGQRDAVPAQRDVMPGQPGAGRRVELQVVRTVPERIYGFAPRGEFRILEAYTRALRSAQRLVYLESQFLWSPQIVDILAAKLREPPDERFRVVVLLPAKPNNGADTTRGQLGVLAAADDGGKRFLAATVSSRTNGERGPLYVHAKVGIVDDRWLTIGSANLNDHSLFNDTEMNVVVCDETLARETRLRLWSEHLELAVDEVAGEPSRVVDELWRPIAVEQLRRRERGEPATHRLTELPGVSRRSMSLLGPVQGLLVDG
jgi:phosphatidylserine/phosphatidylglycerophosphate/cardiolipin synthase-like enzyme